MSWRVPAWEKESQQGTSSPDSAGRWPDCVQGTFMPQLKFCTSKWDFFFIIQKVLANCSSPPRRTGCGSVNPNRSYWLLLSPRVRSWGQSATRLISLKTGLIVLLAFAKLSQLSVTPSLVSRTLWSGLKVTGRVTATPPIQWPHRGFTVLFVLISTHSESSDAFSDLCRQRGQFRFYPAPSLYHTAEQFWTNEFRFPLSLQYEIKWLHTSLEAHKALVMKQDKD